MNTEMAVRGVETASPAEEAPGARPATGSKAMWSRLGLVAVVLAAGVFWGGLAWALWSWDTGLIAIYAQIVGVAIGVTIPVAIGLAFLHKLIRLFR
jgi:hypothetical protein